MDQSIKVEEDEVEVNVCYPAYVIAGVKESLKQADEGKLTPYTGCRDMLNLS